MGAYLWAAICKAITRIEHVATNQSVIGTGALYSRREYVGLDDAS